MEQGYWNNERIAVALERIANHLDFFAEFVKKEMDEEEHEETVSQERPYQDAIFIDKKKFADVYLACKEHVDKYGQVRVGDVKEWTSDCSVNFTDWKYGWKNIGDMKFRDLKNGVIELDCRNYKWLG